MNKLSSINILLSEIKGSVAWGVKKGYGSFVTLEFGRPHLVVREPINKPNVAKLLQRRNVTVVGDYHLWVQNSEWQIFSKKLLIAHNESNQKTIEKACNLLDGQMLVEFLFDTKVMTIKFIFDLEGVLEVKCRRNDPDVQIGIFKFKDTSFSLTGLKTVIIEKSNIA